MNKSFFSSINKVNHNYTYIFKHHKIYTHGMSNEWCWWENFPLSHTFLGMGDPDDWNGFSTCLTKEEFS